MAPSQKRLKAAAMLYEMYEPISKEKLKELVRNKRHIQTNMADDCKNLIDADIEALPFDENSGTLRLCRWCDKLDDVEIPSMQCCGNCKEKGTFVWYCNRKCQRIHWKKGPHKTWCLGQPDIPKGAVRIQQKSCLQQDVLFAASRISNCNKIEISIDRCESGLNKICDVILPLPGKAVFI